MRLPPSLTLIVNTFNQPEFLQRVLKGVSSQSQAPDEVVLADDGSDQETRTVFEKWAGGQAYSCHHVWQERAGFRRARILNLAINRSTKQYLVFLDGDTVPHPLFLADHRRLAREESFVQGHRALIEKRAASFFGEGNFSSDRRRALLRGQILGLKHAYRLPRALCRYRSDLRGVRGCNLAIWRDDLVKVNGYNEAFIGWGREDSELALRLMNSGARRLDVRGWALCYHLWHPPLSRANLSANDQLLETALSTKATWCELGLHTHLSGSQGTATSSSASGSHRVSQ